MADRLMLLDTASLYFRAFYGVPDSLKRADGTPVNAVRGLLDIIARLVTEFEPTHLVACWDDDWRPHWRVELIPSYKAHRVAEVVPGGPDVEETPDPLEAQIPMIRELLAVLGIPVVGAERHEADDVIGTLATGADLVAQGLEHPMPRPAEVPLLAEALQLGHLGNVERPQAGVERRELEIAHDLDHGRGHVEVSGGARDAGPHRR